MDIGQSENIENLKNIDEPEIGERILIGGRGAQLEFVEIEGTGRKKWAVFDGWGELHSYRWQRQDAEALALTLNDPSLELKRGKENDTSRRGDQ